MSSEGENSQQQAKLLMSLLEKYKTKTPREKVLVYRGLPNKTKILEHLNGAGSHSNPKVLKFFEDWRNEWKSEGYMPPAISVGGSNDEEVKALKKRVNELEQQLAQKEAEASEFKRLRGVVEHLKERGVWSR